MSPAANTLVYLYDGTLPGLFSVIYQCEKSRSVPADIQPEHVCEQDLFSDYIYVATDLAHADKVLSAINQHLSRYSYSNIIHTHLSNHEQAGLLIYRYLHFGWQVKKSLDSYLTDQSVKPVLDTAQQVRQESHRMLGLVRFQETTDGLYYARITPDNNILPLIADHFCKRMPNQNWIIHDTGRDLAARYANRDWDIVKLQRIKDIPLSEAEKLYQQLWQDYFQKIAIKERTNKRQQRQYMPVRYWKNLVEKPL